MNWQPEHTITHYAGSIAIALATLALGLAYSAGGQWLGAVIVAVIGLLWWLGDRRQWSQAPTMGFVGFVCAAALGLWVALPPLGMLLGLLLTLAAWDLQHFGQRLRTVQRVDAANRLIRSHLQYLLVVLVVGAVAGVVALGLDIRLPFGWRLLTGAIALFGLAYVIAVLRRTND
ncbi:MAG: hypothetical protein H0X37_15450 [Herpetosiphonaceae bacterium]|nr:hypothetical protein [Herpetosiphonaceae bacterium]